MTPLTIQILSHNNENLLKTIESLLPLNAYITIINIGCLQKKYDFVEKYDIKIKEVDKKLERSKIRNDFIQADKNEWMMYIEPGEVISSGHENILEAIKEEHTSRRLFVVRDDLIIKETRLWKKSSNKFVYPVYETLSPDTNPKICNAFISGSIEETDNLDILVKWKEREPQNPQPDYYLAIQHLVNKKYQDYLKYANLYFFREKEKSQSLITLHYYHALVELHHSRNVHECIRHITFCLTEKPLMAEYWCVLGDALYKTGMVEQAQEMFYNAIVLGQERETDDDFPVELSKYKDYPEKMINLCGAIRGNNDR